MSNQSNHDASTSDPLHAEVRDRFGVLPNFFRLAPEAPAITENLWGFAKFGYLDNPLPPLFKERLFVYLSRFCEVRYCIARHVGFLAGLGRPSGDRLCPPEAVEQVVRLIRRELPRGDDLQPHLANLAALPSPASVAPDPDTPTEEAVFACATHVFLQTPQASGCLGALRRVFDGPMFQHLLVFLSFVRTAHFWTKLHPELQVEEDVTDLLAVHEALAECVVNDPEAGACETTQSLMNELAELRRDRALRQEVERANVALREREAELQEAQRVAHLGSWRWDAETDVTTGSGELFRIYGLDPARQPFPGFAAQDGTLYPHEEWERISRAIQEAMRTGVGYELDVRAFRNGEPIWITTRSEAVKNATGEVVGLRGTVQDIADRKRAEAELRQSENRERLRADELGTVMAAVPAVVWIAHDRECRRITGNRAASELLRLPHEANQSVTAPEGERPVHFKVMKDGVELRPDQLPVQMAAAGVEVRDFEEEVVFEDGTRTHLFGHAIPLRDGAGRVRGSVAAFVDITDRKRAEAALRQSEGRLTEELEATTRLHALSSRLLSAADLATALGDVLENAVETCRAGFGTIQLLNPQNGALEIVAQRGFREDFLNYFRSVRVDEGSACAQAMRSGERIVIEDVSLDPAFEPHRGVAAAAGYRAVQSTPLKTHDGAILGMLSTHFRLPHRVSERDERLLDLYARHAADLIERLRFEQALTDADRRKDEFLATLAHELRNPLAPLRNGLQVLRLAGTNGEMADRARTMMERQLGQMVHLIDDLLDLSRISRGKIELRKERVELAKVVQQAVETSRPAIEQAGHEFLIDVPTTSIYVDADVTRLAQVFSNLLNNAAKYTERGGRVRLTVRRHGTEAVVSVRDSGVGIPAHMLPHVFEMFTQVDRNLERSQGGLGIGLSIVKRLVEMHGGGVEARSDGHGMGSEFVVRLPVVLSAVQPQSDEAEPVGSSSRRRVLVVDDNRDAAVSLAMMLDLMGNETRTAHDGLEALDVAAAYRPDLILLDIGMPRMNGYDTARQIRRQPWGEGVVLVALTGWGQEEDRRKSQEAGFDSHVTKPIEPAALEKLLTNLKAETG